MPTIITICGPSGTGKSTLAQALVAHLGPTRAVRIPTDYYLLPAPPPAPLAYDWPLLAQILALPDDTATTTPDFDFATFQRRSTTGGRPLTLRPIAILDAIHPYPHADLRILLTAPEPIRRARIVARDATWRTNIAARWPHLEAAHQHLATTPHPYHLTLPGTASPAENAARIATIIHNHHNQ